MLRSIHSSHRSLSRWINYYRQQPGNVLTDSSINHINRLASTLSPAIIKRLEGIVSETNNNKSQRHLKHLDEKRKALFEEMKILKELQKDAAGNDEAVQECVDELKTLEDSVKDLEKKIVDALIEVSDNEEDSSSTDAIIEVRAGAGGDEASLFARELMDCYRNTAKNLNFKVELLSETPTGLGGIRESSLSVTSSPYGSNTTTPYDFFRFESGVHRVQRVPVNDARIHTSACSVAVLKQQASDTSKDEKFEIPVSELRIDTMRATGAGGQSVNTTDSAVRITHLPTGTTVSMQDERSQRQNREKALRLITARVRDAQLLALAAEKFQTRSSLLGGGDRHERIRTFNYPQDRVTDHRCKETRHGIEILMNGTVEDGLVATFLPYLRELRRQEQLEALEEWKD